MLLSVKARRRRRLYDAGAVLIVGTSTVCVVTKVKQCATLLALLLPLGGALLLLLCCIVWPADCGCVGVTAAAEAGTAANATPSRPRECVSVCVACVETIDSVWFKGLVLLLYYCWW